MTKTLYIVRHGETDYNLQKRVQGSGIDSDINEKGIAQATAFYESYKHLDFDKVYLSTLKRTNQTLLPFIDLGLPYEKHKGLDEMCWGYNEGKTPDELDNDYYNWLMNEWKSGQTDIPVRGGESPQEVQNRQIEFLEYLLQQEDESTVLICMHGRAMRIFLSLLLDTDLHLMDQYKHSNVCLYILKQNANGGFDLILNNDVTHLEAELVSA